MYIYNYEWWIRELLEYLENLKSNLISDANKATSSYTNGRLNLIDEIFIYPELRKISDNYSDTKIKFPAIINSHELMNKDDGIRFIFTGDESCGKSTLVKKMFLNYYEKNFVPILLSGDDLTEVELSITMPFCPDESAAILESFKAIVPSMESVTVSSSFSRTLTFLTATFLGALT